MPQPGSETVTVCEPVPDVRPASEYATDDADAPTVTVVDLAPSVMVAIPPAVLLVKLIVPDTVYWLVAELHVPGVAVAVREQTTNGADALKPKSKEWLFWPSEPVLKAIWADVPFNTPSLSTKSFVP